MDQPRLLAAFGDDRLDAFFFAECLVTTDKLDLQSRLGSQPLGVLAQLVPQRLGPASIVEHTDAQVAEQAAHRLGVSDVGQRSGDDNPVEA